MADPMVRTWSIDPNNAFVAPADRDEQYKEALYNFKNTFVLAGWVVIRSSNTTDYGDSDNWASSADIVIAATPNSPWIILESPPGWLPNSGTVQMKIYVNDTAGTPNRCDIRFCSAGYHSGNLTTLPVAFGFETTAKTFNIIGWNAILTGRWQSWYTARGDVMFGVKEEFLAGDAWDSEFKSFFIIQSFEDGDGDGEGDQRWAMWSSATSGAFGVFDNQAILATSNWVSLAPHGNSAHTTRATTIFSNIGWGLGEDFNGALIHTKITVWQEGGVQARRIGQLADVWATANNTREYQVDGTEGAQDPRKYTIGEIWVPMLDAAIPLL